MCPQTATYMCLPAICVCAHTGTYVFGGEKAIAREAMHVAALIHVCSHTIQVSAIYVPAYC